ncbi:hypothetical protein LINGRAHAP2_LOCUS35959 [Linum grandiflorum]
MLADLMIRSSISSSSSESDHKKLLRIEQGKSILDFKDPDMCGLVFACGDSRVRVVLINLNRFDEQQFRYISVAFPNNLTTDFSLGWSFTIVESKLFATGGRAKHVINHKDYYDYGFAVREVYFCDLRDAFTNNNTDDVGESWLEFKIAVTLNCPKRSPLVVPYKDKIFFIANPCEEEKHTLVVNPPCEILHLGEFNHVKPLASPKFWQDHDPTREETFLNGHVVVRNKLYVRVISTNKALPTLYCLDMDVELWEAEECVCIPHILKDAVHEGDNNRPWNYVHGNKLFKLEMDEEDSTVFSFSVEILIKDDHDHDHKVEVDLKCVVDSMGLQGHYYIFDGWVFPCEEEKTSTDVFCLMFSLADLANPIDTYFCLCKFKLTDDCSVNRLTKRAIYVPIPRIFGGLMIGFTPGITKELDKGNYSTKLIYRDSALERKKREEAKRADPNREEAKREYKRREDARREAAKQRREAKKKEAAMKEEANRELKVERLYLRHVEWALEDEFLDSEEEPTFSSEEEEE